MKSISRLSIAIALGAATFNFVTAAEPGGRVEFGKFAAPSNGGQFVEVHIKSNLIGLATRFVEKEEPEIADLLKGLHEVRVNVIGIDESNRAELQERIKSIRSQLETAGWERVVTAQEKGQDVGIYLKTQGSDAVEGLVVTVIEGDKEAVFVNVVGNIKPEQLTTIGERFDIAPLKHLPGKAQKS